MRCGLVDIRCHLWAFVLSWPWWVHAGLFLCLALALWGVGARLWSFAKGLGGWQASVAALGAAGLVLAAVWPRKGRQVATDDMFPHPDGEKPRSNKSRPKVAVRKTKGDPLLRQPGETVADWWERLEKKD